jgi:hypothetical protein
VPSRRPEVQVPSPAIPGWVAVHDDRITIRLTKEAVEWIKQRYGDPFDPTILDRVAKFLRGKGSRRKTSRSGPVAPSLSRSSSDILLEIIAKRKADLLTASHVALATKLRGDKEFARRYPTIDIQPSRIANEVKLRFGTKKQSKGDRYDWSNIDAFLHLSRGESPTASRRALALYVTHNVITTILIPRLLPILPGVTRQDVVTLVRNTWPSSRGILSKPMFDRNLVKAGYQALERENPNWGVRSIREELARRLNVSPRTIANLTGKKS